MHVMGANVRHLLYIGGVNNRPLPTTAAHIFWESVVINAGCDVVMAAAASIILLLRAKSSF